ncbi:hypothetical protein Tco_1293871 [Tanacetum coccineum]
MFIKYSTSQIPPNKSRGKGSHGKKPTDTTKETIDVSEESDPEPTKKRTASRRVVKKKVTITADDNIVPEPDIALELGKSISLIKAAEDEAARQVHATHKLKGIQTLTPEKQMTADTRKALKEIVPATSSEGTGTKPGVPDEEKVTSEANVILEWGSEQESEYSKEEDDDETIE